MVSTEKSPPSSALVRLEDSSASYAAYNSGEAVLIKDVPTDEIPPMTMEDWKTKLDAFLRFNDADVLQDKGKVTAAIAKEFAESEFEKYRVIQDSLYESDFDKLMNDMEKDGTTH